MPEEDSHLSDRAPSRAHERRHPVGQGDASLPVFLSKGRLPADFVCWEIPPGPPFSKGGNWGENAISACT